ncbi:MAG: hypothetical protein Q7K21_02350 [Elusimicrobiota bacterium]|nr:hypothetical protein [Elusimicrobiota bacterium]
MDKKINFHKFLVLFNDISISIFWVLIIGIFGGFIVTFILGLLFGIIAIYPLNPINNLSPHYRAAMWFMSNFSLYIKISMGMLGIYLAFKRKLPGLKRNRQ